MAIDFDEIWAKTFSTGLRKKVFVRQQEIRYIYIYISNIRTQSETYALRTRLYARLILLGRKPNEFNRE